MRAGTSRIPRRFLLILLGTCCLARGQAPLFGELHHMLPADRDFLAPMAVADLDGDGDPDILGNRLYLNDGRGVFTLAPANLPAGIDLDCLSVGDVDGDGDLDALLGRTGNQPNQLLLNDGSGHFADASNRLPPHAEQTSDVALFDVDGDQDLDALVLNMEQQNRLYLNDGLGWFTDASSQLPTETDPSTAVGIADVDGDGDLDAVVANSEIWVCDPWSCWPWEVSNRLYLNDGSGIFSFSSLLPADVDPTRSLLLGDVDGDNDPDLVTASHGVPQYHLYLNGGGGAYSLAPAQPAATSFSPDDLALADLDGDGDLDLLIAAYSRLYRYWNDGSGVFQPSGVETLTHGLCKTVLAQDLDGDTDPDVLVGQDPQVNRLYLNDGSGTLLLTAGALPPDSNRTQALAVGDIDQDLDLDIFVGNYGSRNRLYLNDGTGVFLDAPTALPFAANALTEALALGDVDGDGDLDVLLGYSNELLWLNDGTGVFSDASGQIPPDPDRTRAIALADYDGDNDLDAVFGNCPWNGGQNRLFLNDGSGVFADATSQLPTITDGTVALAVGDLDGDMDLDIVVGNGFGGSPLEQNRLYLNSGSATFTDATTQLPAQAEATRALALGDVDGDNDLDLAVGNNPYGSSSAGQDRLYLNDGTGVFTEALGALPPAGLATTFLLMKDVDGDGDPDIFTGTGAGSRLLLNDGLGVFTEAPDVLGDLGVGLCAAISDIDGDDDQDIVLGAPHHQNRLAANLTRHLAWRGIPSFGKPLTIAFFGPPNESWIVGFSLGTLHAPLPPWGTLRIDPLSLLILGPGTLDAQGRDALTFPIAANPGGAAGLTIYGQALVGLSPTFTNLERFTFTDL